MEAQVLAYNTRCALRSDDAGSYAQHTPYTQTLENLLPAQTKTQVRLRFPKCFYFLPGRPRGRHRHGMATTVNFRRARIMTTPPARCMLIAELAANGVSAPHGRAPRSTVVTCGREKNNRLMSVHTSGEFVAV